jgi:surface carbohydrate biosynthesis protein
VRELDAKILLACVAAHRGFSCVIGSRLELDFRIASFPRSIYLSKSMTARSVKMFRIMQKLGHEIMAWDEEALVHQPPATYFPRRLSPAAITQVSRLFAWGEDNAQLWREYPQLPANLPIHVTGNPRGDMLRPEMLDYYAQESEALRKTYGDFLLVNTNFSNVNAFYPSQNLFLPVESPDEKPRFGLAAVGMSREFAEGLCDHKKAIFEDFKRLIPALEKAFPKHTIVVRPHPTENPRVYHDIASQSERVKVTNEGNVIPWLSAAEALIHNGCTTGVEAYIMGVPAVSYQATVNEYYDGGFYRLPNALSHQSFNFEELVVMLQKTTCGELGAADGEDRRALMASYLTALDGPLASERIVEVLEEIVEGCSEFKRPAFLKRFHGRFLASKRRAVKRFKSYLPGSKYRPEFQRYRYPGISLSEFRIRVKRFQNLLGNPEELIAEQISDYIFRISKRQ